MDNNFKPTVSTTPSFLIVIYTTICILSLVFTNKIIRWHGIDISCCLIAFPMIFTLGDVIAEVYGYLEAKKLIYYTALSCLLFSGVSSFILKIPSAHFYDNNIDYQHVLGNDFKFTIIGIIAILAGSFVNIYTISRWKILLRGKHFWLRSIGATGIGELINSMIAFPLGFASVLNWHEIVNITIASYFIKLIYAIIAAYPASLFVNILKNSENFKPANNAMNYNPFVE